jgi:hypothetical protein
MPASFTSKDSESEITANGNPCRFRQVETRSNYPPPNLIIEKPCAQPNNSADTAQQKESQKSKTPFLKERSKELSLPPRPVAPPSSRAQRGDPSYRRQR